MTQGERTPLRVWYVAAQRLCNLDCTYCVSVGDYAKSDRIQWNEGDLARFDRILEWIVSQGRPVELRLGTLGEPFTTPTFLDRVAKLSHNPAIRFIELVTNASLVKARLPGFSAKADLTKVSLWATHHPTELTMERFIANIVAAKDVYGLEVVVNGLLFPDNIEHLEELSNACTSIGVPFNVDFGYDPGTAIGVHDRIERMVPALSARPHDAVDAALGLGCSPEMMETNLTGLRNPGGQPCSAGYDYIYIGRDGRVFPCSRYYVLEIDELGNVFDPDFRLNQRSDRWHGCKAEQGCCNKEDFLNLKLAPRRSSSALSLGVVGSDG